MSEQRSDRVEDRAAHLLPEERSAGSDDPQAQAAAILADSDRREAGVIAGADSGQLPADPPGGSDPSVERRTSAETALPEPPD